MLFATDAYIRAYALPETRKAKKNDSASDESKEYKPYSYVGKVLCFDYETEIDAFKKPLYATYILTECEEDGSTSLLEVGFVYVPENLSREEVVTVKDFAKDVNPNEIATRLGLVNESTEARVQTQKQFQSWVERQAYYSNLILVGQNAVFDLSRLESGYSLPNGNQYGSFKMQLSKKLALSVRSLGFAKHIIKPIARKYVSRKTGKEQTSMEFRGVHVVDLMMLSGALLDKPYSLLELGKRGLKLPEDLWKIGVDGGYRPSYKALKYALQDTISTQACFMKLHTMYKQHQLSLPVWNVISGASIAKALMAKAGFIPFLEKEPDFPPDIIAKAMSSYFGGRTFIGMRLKPTRGILHDYSSLYPFANGLMDLQALLFCKQTLIDRNAKREIQKLLSLPVDELMQKLQTKEFWPCLTVLVRVKPEGNLRLPVRAKYDGNSTNISLPWVTSKIPLWYSLPDLIAARLLGGGVPEVLEAIKLSPGKKKYAASPVAIMGNEEAVVDANTEDFFIRLGDLRQQYKAIVKSGKATGTEAEIEKAIKVYMNSGSYGVNVEIQQKEETEDEEIEGKQIKKKFSVAYYDVEGNKHVIEIDNKEVPGKYFSPVGVFITSGARLALALAEKLYADRGIHIGLADTDSAFACLPDGMDWEEFKKLDTEVADWLQVLSPWQDKNVRVFKKEVADSYLFGVSSKRYSLYTHDKDGEIEPIKISMSGTGTLRRPYGGMSKLEGVPQWVYDFWVDAIKAFENKAESYYPSGPKLAVPALHQMKISTPYLMKIVNKNLHGIMPYSWFNLLQPLSRVSVQRYTDYDLWDCEKYQYDDEQKEWVCKSDSKDIARISIEVAKAKTSFFTASDGPELVGTDKKGFPIYVVRDVFRTDTGEKVPDNLEWKTINEVLLFYFSHPETKMENGKERGLMRERHIEIVGVKYVGKEINELLEEVQGDSNGALGRYDIVEYQEDQEIDWRKTLAPFNKADIMLVSGIAVRTLYDAIGGRKPNSKTTQTLLNAMPLLKSDRYSHWRKWEERRLARIAQIDQERAHQLILGRVSFTQDERRLILAEIEREQKQTIEQEHKINEKPEKERKIA